MRPPRLRSQSCGIEASRYLEAMCMAWVLAGFSSGDFGHAFKLLRA